MHCHHPDCDCNTTSIERHGRSYCSEACATGTALTSSLQEDGCKCGHAGCGATAEIPISERPTVEMRAGTHRADTASPDEGRGLTGDGMVGGTRQRLAEQPGHASPDRQAEAQGARLGYSEEDTEGAAMKPGAAVSRAGVHRAPRTSSAGRAR